MNRVLNLVAAGTLTLVLVGCDVEDATPEPGVPADRTDVPLESVQVPVTDDGVRADVDVNLGDGAAVQAPADGEADTLPELRQQRRQERRERIGEALENVDVQVDDANVDVNVE